MPTSPALSAAPSAAAPSLTLPSDPLTSLRAAVAQDDSYRRNPVAWVRERLGEHPWSKQQDILNSVRDNRRTAVHSCHNIGKSFIASRVCAWWLSVHPPGEAFVVTSARNFKQVRAVLWREIGRVHAKARLAGRTNQTEWFMQLGPQHEEIVAFGTKPDDWDPTAFQGIHARYVLVIFDEACGITAPLWEAADTLISNTDSRFLAIGNPDDPNTEFGEVCKPGSGWSVIGVSAHETPNFTGEEIPDHLRNLLISPLWVDEKLRKWGETNPLYISKVLGQFPELTTDGIIPIRWIKEAQDRTLAPGAPCQLGVDVGGGGDKSVIAIRRGGHVRIHSRDQNPDTMQTTGRILSVLRETGAEVAKVDEIGIGRGVVDRAKEQKAAVVGVNVGQSARDSESYANLRAEGYWGLRERFQEGSVDLDPADDDLAAQLADLKYKRTSSGKIQIESKDDLKRRGKPSPDEADAVMLAFLPEPKRKVISAVWGSRRQVQL